MHSVEVLEGVLQASKTFSASCAGLADYMVADGEPAESRALQLARDIAKARRSYQHAAPLLPSVTSMQDDSPLAGDGLPGMQGGPIALRMAKAAINHGMGVDLQTGFALEQSYYAQVLDTLLRLSKRSLLSQVDGPHLQSQSRSG